jgi:hypothetical protein
MEWISHSKMNIELDRYSTFHFIPFEKLQREFNPKIPDFQRSHNETRVQHFVNTLVKYFEDQAFVYNLNPIQLGKLNDEYFILDGQHRYLAYSRLARDYDLEGGNAFSISAVVRKCADEQELRAHFSVLNDHFISADLETRVEEMDAVILLKRHVQEKYGKYISHANKPKFPNVPLDAFVSFVKSRFDTIEKFTAANTDIGEYLRVHEPERYHKVAVKNPSDPLFFAHVFHSQRTGTPRVQIPATVRRALWESKFGLEKLDGVCFVCGSDINYHTFHAGHIVPVASGGSNLLTNLECVCISCNLSMGAQNLSEFKEKYFA